MKILKHVPVGIFSATVIIMFISGCKKEPIKPMFTVDDAVVVVTSTIGNTGGMSAELAAAASYSIQSLSCGVAQNTTVNKNFTATGGTFNYSAPWVYSSKCTNNTRAHNSPHLCIGKFHFFYTLYYTACKVCDGPE